MANNVAMDWDKVFREAMNKIVEEYDRQIEEAIFGIGDPSKFTWRHNKPVKLQQEDIQDVEFD